MDWKIAIFAICFMNVVAASIHNFYPNSDVMMPTRQINKYYKQTEQEQDLDDAELINDGLLNCGATIDGETVSKGLVTTPNYPQLYGSGLKCKWTIKGGQGKRVKLHFDDFDITRTADCHDDYVIVSSVDPDGLTTNSVKLCGSELPNDVISETDIMCVEFTSSPAGDTCRGFSAEYSMEEVVASCGDEISALQFDFQSPHFPSPIVNESSHCELTVSHDCEIPICQLRLDFERFELQPPLFGDCDYDQFVVRANEPVPILCGVNDGHHIYVDVSERSSTSLHFLTSPINAKPVGHTVDPETGDISIENWLHEIEDSRMWKVRVNQIPCDCKYNLFDRSPRAPTGCLQYYTGVQDTIRSFNFDGIKRDLEPCYNGNETRCNATMWTGHLNNLDYQICIRTQEGYCGIMHEVTGPQSFLLTGRAAFNDSADDVKNLAGSKWCQSDYIIVPKSRTPGDGDPWQHDRFCGKGLGNFVEGPIVSYSTPFYMNVKTDSDEYSQSVDTENRGFELSYTQLPCSGPYLFNTDQKFSG